MRYVFGDSELNVETWELWCAGAPVHAEPQVLAVLEYLIAHRDRVVTKVELLDEVWGSRFVSESALTTRIKTVRRLCGDTGRAQRIIRTVHGRGYRFVADVERVPTGDAPVAISGAPTPVGATPVGATPAGARRDGLIGRGGLIGREAELAVIDAALRDGVAGCRSTVFITGPAGIGKSAFLSAAVEQLDEGWHVLRGQALPSRATVEPYFPLLDALSRAGRSDDGAVAAALDRVAPTWLAQLPALVRPEDADRLERRLLGGSAQRMLREGVEAIEELARTAPVALVLEDLHWADACTLDVLELLVQRSDPLGVVVLATARRGPSAVANLAGAAVLSGRARQLELAALATPEVEALMAAALDGAAIGDELLGVVRRRGAGVPLFVLEIVRAWRRLGQVVVANGAAEAAVPAAELEAVVPDTLRQLVEHDLDRMEPHAAALLQAAALVGTEFDAACVAAALDEPLAAIDAALTAAARRLHHIDAVGGSTWPDGTVSTRFEFTHDLYRQVLEERRSHHQAALAHDRLARALERGYAGQRQEVAARIAAHAVAAGDAVRAVEYLRQVGEQAVSRSAFEHATRAFLQALQQLERLPEGAVDERDRAELRIRLAMGPALVATRGWFGVEVAENYERALAICASRGPCPEAALARYGLATITELRGQYAMTEQLLLPLVTDHNEIAVEANELMACSAFHQGKFQLSLGHATSVLDAWDGESSSALMSRLAEHPASACNSWASLAAWCLGRFDASLRYAAQAIAIGERHPYALSTAQVQLAFLHQLRREPEECRHWALEAIELAGAQGFPMRQLQAEMLLGWAEASQGSRGGAPRIAAALGRFRESGARLSEAYFLGIQADAALMDGQPDAALTLLDEACRSMSLGARTFFAGPELHRLTARALTARGGAGDEAVAHVRIAAAIDGARALGSPVLELRALIDAVRIGAAPDGPSAARRRLVALLADVDGGECVDVVAARSLLGGTGAS